jgi:hypothetical protein
MTGGQRDSDRDPAAQRLFNLLRFERFIAKSVRAPRREKASSNEECISDAAELSRSRNARPRGRPNALSKAVHRHAGADGVSEIDTP